MDEKNTLMEWAAKNFVENVDAAFNNHADAIRALRKKLRRSNRRVALLSVIAIVGTLRFGQLETKLDILQHQIDDLKKEDQQEE